MNLHEVQPTHPELSPAMRQCIAYVLYHYEGALFRITPDLTLRHKYYGRDPWDRMDEWTVKYWRDLSKDCHELEGHTHDFNPNDPRIEWLAQ